MRIIHAGETGHKVTTADVAAKTVKCEHVSTHPSLPEGSKFNVTWFVDLSNLSEKDLLEAAAEYFIIKIRRDFVKAGIEKKDGKVIRKNPPDSEKWDNVTFDADKYVTRRQSAKEKLLTALSQFTDEQLAEWGLKRADTEAEEETDDE